MFKRANKITSLLVAAASVATMVPAYAADVKKVDSQEGTVYNAVAYKDGTAYVDGEVNDNDSTYYLKDGKYNELADIDSGSDVSAYGTKYVKVDDGKDYNVDLSTGKVIDENVSENDTDDAQTALRKKAKEVNRWNNDSTVLPDLQAIPGLKFGETWYETTGKSGYSYTTAASGKDADGKGIGAPASYANIFTDKDGNYIDADYNMGKIKVETTKASATIENSVDLEDLDSTGTTKAGAAVTKSIVLGQDKDYIYRYAEIKVVVAGGANQTVKINNKNFALGTDGSITLPVIQKISKAQDSSDKDEAKYAKTVYNYVISKDDVSNLSPLGGSTANDQSNYALYANQTGAKAAVIGGKLVIYYVDNNNSTSDNVFVQAATLKQKNGYYYTDVESKTTIQGEYNDKLNKVAIDTDVDGNIYVLDGGYVKKFDGTDDWTKIYKVDGSFNAISTYDKDNMVAWSQADEVYSVIGGKSTDDTKKDDTTTTTPAAAGWAKNTDGSWSFNKADGTKATGWYTDTTGTWYYSNANGIMLANAWAQDSAGAWYYLGGSGAMTVNAWVQSGGKYYYVGATGAMLVNTTTPDGYWVGADGAWV
ncbi:hypothetical protein [Clostridium saccharoperbutylacetonicum]|uniref:hypothetical protein n=1 Tax=Clostridium saccharoperbutylacetonicum TaxID=36745 RepID=UPI000983C577|nr:hypothetical protein [Clostridium saccharoperbutylacetonicum]AQR97850.1 autolysin [Clostridium saccharoperbutylacetonicum]NSB33742.1 hypothetical protein [Clostridium saccharoperbutylacetonicum]